MNRTFSILLLLSVFTFSSCLHRPATDIETDQALGVAADQQASQAQQELENIQKDQLREQKRQLDRQITDPVQP